MNLMVINSNTFNMVGMVSSYISCLWHVQFSNFGDFELIVPATTENINLLRIKRILVRECDLKTDGSADNAMFIEKTVLTYDADMGYTLTVTGRGVKAILTRRIVWEQTNFTNEYLRNIMYSLVVNNMGADAETERKIDGVSVGILDTDPKGPQITVQLLGENIGDWVVKAAEDAEFGWRILLTGINAGNGPSYLFQFVEGTDRSSTVLFSPSMDNLISSEYTYDITNYKNTALVGGEGEGSDKTFAEVGNPSGMNRYETYINAQQISSNDGAIAGPTYEAMLQRYGSEQLAPMRDTKSFYGVIDTDGILKIDQDYFLGDLVKVSNEKNIEGTTRLTEIIYADDQEGYRVVGTFSETEV